jgi:hypothetical protein
MTERWFTTSTEGAQGDGSGSSWANRAVLVSGSTWSTIITGWNFPSSGTLICYVGPGTYSVSGKLDTANITNPPTVYAPLIFHGCDSSGNPLTPPDPDWKSNQEPWDDSSLPVLSSSGNINIFNLSSFSCACLLKFVSSGNTTNSTFEVGKTIWCHAVNSTSNASTRIGAGVHHMNSVFKMTGTVYSDISAGVTISYNSKYIGNSSASAGNGILPGTNQVNVFGCTFVDHPNYMIKFGSGTLSQNHNVLYNLFYNCTTAIQLASVASQSNTQKIIHNYFGNCSTVIDCNTNAKLKFYDNRCIQYTNLLINENAMGTITPFNDFDAASTASDELVNVATGDYRIKNTVDVWGKNYGPSDQPRSGGGTVVSLL